MCQRPEHTSISMAIWLSVMQIRCLCVPARQEGQQMFAHQLRCHSRPIWTPDSKFSPTRLKIRIKEKRCWRKRPLNSSPKPPCPFGSARFLLVAHVEGKNKCDAQCSFTGFLISVPHEGVFMLTTSDSTSWHYCTPHQGILSEGSTKAHSNGTMRPTWAQEIYTARFEIHHSISNQLDLHRIY